MDEKEFCRIVADAAGYLATAALAALAGALKYLQQYSGPEAPPWNWRIFLVQVATAILAGKISEWLFDGWKLDHNITLAAVALAGWGGAQAIALAERRLGTKTFGANSDAEN